MKIFKFYMSSFITSKPQITTENEFIFCYVLCERHIFVFFSLLFRYVLCEGHILEMNIGCR